MDFKSEKQNESALISGRLLFRRAFDRRGGHGNPRQHCGIIGLLVFEWRSEIISRIYFIAAGANEEN